MKKEITEIKLTQKAKDSLLSEFNELKEVKLPGIIIRVTKAREQGDLSENAEYHSAKDEQSLTETRISEIEDILDRAKIIKESTSKIKVGVGSIVKLKQDGKKEVTFKIVSEFDKDEKHKTISSESPMGRALINCKKGEKITVKTPGGDRIYQIIKID
jgi:transcription elongation factor GreA